MPVYVFKCTVCNHVDEEFEHSPKARKNSQCSFCGSLSERDISKENVTVIGDIEPKYNWSLGEYVTSRRDLREKLAYHNAYTPDIMLNGSPSAGRLTSEERAEFEGRRVGEKISDPEITVEGEADYDGLKKELMSRHMAKRKVNN